MRGQCLPSVYPHVMLKPRPSPTHNYFTRMCTRNTWVPRLPSSRNNIRVTFEPCAELEDFHHVMRGTVDVTGKLQITSGSILPRGLAGDRSVPFLQRHLCHEEQTKQPLFVQCESWKSQSTLSCNLSVSPGAAVPSRDRTTTQRLVAPHGLKFRVSRALGTCANVILLAA